MFGWATNRIVSVLNCTYAPYASCKALMSPDAKDDVKWLMYWVVNVLVMACEGYFAFALVVPFWSELKCALYLSMLFDGPVRTTTVFEKLVKPYFLKYENMLDKHLANLPADARKYMENVKSSEAVQNLVTMSKEQAEGLVGKYGPDVVDKMMQIARMQQAKASKGADGNKKD